jgi:peptidoglycan-associated lipoprotein
MLTHPFSIRLTRSALPVARSAAALVAIAFALSACHKHPPATTPSRTDVARPAAPARPPAPPPAPAAAPRPSSAALSDADIFARKSLDDLNREQPLHDVFFDLDENTLRDDARRVLQQDAQWLAKWPTTAIRIDGHCDERGSAEYNLGLGDRRAAAVRDYLASLGVRSDRIQIRSLGREAPFCHDDGESCWSQNRRGHFVITGK